PAPAAPGYGQMLRSPSTALITSILSRAQSVSVDVLADPSFGYQQWSLITNGGSLGYHSVDGFSFSQSPTLMQESTLTWNISGADRAAYAAGAATSTPIQLIFQVGGGGGGTMYLDNLRTTILTNYNWKDIAGSWGTGGNWQEGVTPDQTENGNVHGAGTTVTFSSATANRTVTLDGNHTVGHVVFNNPNSYTIDPGSGGTLTIDNSPVTFSDTRTTT